jgi:uncharacterized protein YegP (UPF0339 family)
VFHRGTKEFYKDRDRQWRSRIRAANGKIVADSAEGYHNFKDARRGLKVALLVLLFGRTKITRS